MASKTALLSVSDKTGLVSLARQLVARDFRILSSGGTAKALESEGVPVETVEAYTGSPEVMGGRVKTLHPRVHGGILSRGDEDAADLVKLGGRLIDLVIVNLYPFEKTVGRGAADDVVVENIDIGGPSMVRSAAKNHARVTVVCDPADYDRVIAALLPDGTVPLALRRALAAKAFAHTAAYDGAIAAYLSREEEARSFPRYLTLAYERAYPLRYGENPHQSAAFYVERQLPQGSLAAAESLGSGGKELSFNNLVDVDAAFDAVSEHERPTAVVVKHTNPCGVATAETLDAAYLAAREADPVSAFGGIVALNRPVDAKTAELLAATFLECVIAPSFDEAALAVLRAKKNLRLLATGTAPDGAPPWLQYKRVQGGLLAQTRDATGATEVRQGKVVTRRAPTEEELSGLDFAWKVAKHVKSNAIVLAKPGRTVGVGAGQMSRVVSVQIAVEKAGAEAKGSVLASDAFFPFADGLEAALKAGVTAIVQPGGSVRDADVIAAADAASAAMVFTGVRHFRH
jgi:phosphoribosylaminoimidazolecarboxamide formyltransferase / IMP cyclohydrolase